MRVVPFTSDLFGFDGRGPSLRRFLHDRDALKAGTFSERSVPPGDIIGVEYCGIEDSEPAWVIFRKRQVIQIVPEEVCSYWFMNLVSKPTKGVGIFVVENSSWLRSFKQRHLGSCRHFVLMFYDEILEVIAEDLVFGRGAFRIEDHPDLSYYK